MATTKKSTAKKRKPAAKKPTKAQLQAKRELNAIILFALGVLLLLLAAIPGDNAWNTVHNVLRGLMGWCCYLMGPLMMIVAVLLTMDRTAITPGLKSASVVLMVLLLCGITHIIGGSAAEGTFAESIKALYRGGTALTGGGACAILFGVYPLRWLGRTGALIVDILLFFVFFMISTGTTLIGLFRGAAKPVKKLEEAYTAAVENRQAAAEAAEAAQKKNRRNFNIDVVLEGEEKSPAAARKEALTKEGEASRRKVERLTDAMKVSTNTGRAYDFDSEPDKPVESTPAPEPQPDFQPVAPPVANAAPTPAETSIEDTHHPCRQRQRRGRGAGGRSQGRQAALWRNAGGKGGAGRPGGAAGAGAGGKNLHLPAGQPAGRAQGRLRRQYPKGAARQCRSAGGYAAQLRGRDPHRGYFPRACRYPV